MIRHIVMWNFVVDMTKEEKSNAFLKMKELLEPIKDMLDGVITLEVVENKISSSNREVMLISEFETIEDLKKYQVFPAHVEAGKFVGKVTCDRACFDYEL